MPPAKITHKHMQEELTQLLLHDSFQEGEFVFEYGGQSGPEHRCLALSVEVYVSRKKIVLRILQ